MNRLNLVSIAKDILQIELWMNREPEYKKKSWEIVMFQQWWGNTSGGFEGIGGSMMTKETTYVIHDNNIAYIFFSGRFAYKVKINDKFIDDLKHENIAGKQSYRKYYEE